MDEYFQQITDGRLIRRDNIMKGFNNKPSYFDQLSQINEKKIEDGNLISKDDRDILVKMGYCEKKDGMNYITQKGRNHYNDCCN